MPLDTFDKLWYHIIIIITGHYESNIPYSILPGIVRLCHIDYDNLGGGQAGGGRWIS